MASALSDLTVDAVSQAIEEFDAATRSLAFAKQDEFNKVLAALDRPSNTGHQISDGTELRNPD